MSKLELILSIVAVILAFTTSTLIPFWVKLKKAKAEATQSKEDIAAAQKAEDFANKMLEMTNLAQEVIGSLEKQFDKQDAAIKSVSPTLSLGATKRECALAQLSEKATVLGMPFDREYWGKIVDGIVKLTREVNMRDKDKPKATTAA